MKKTSKAHTSDAPASSLLLAGFQDHHCHLDRANTENDRYFTHVDVSADQYREAPLPVKQNATGDLHLGEAYTEKCLYDRMKSVVEAKWAAKETVLYAIVDCSPDIDGRAFRTALKLREEYKGQIDIKVGAYPIFGFKSFNSDRHLHLLELAPKAQFLVGLPERDGRGDKDNNVGFDGHLAILLELGIKLKIPVDVHVDQTGRADENGTELLVDSVRWLITSRIPIEERPRVWAVHMISPSAYEEDRFWALVSGLKKNNIGVKVCPRAALSMRQVRSQNGPMRNSIARVKELLVSGIEVRFGTDNINDIFMPTPKSPLLAREAGEEFGVIQDAIRLYDQAIYNKIMRGAKLNETDLLRVEESLKGDYAASGWYGQRPWRKV